MRTATFIVAILAISSSASADVFKDATILEGRVTHVRDGDTVEVGGIPIRLQGVSAPELKEPLGLKSKRFMVDLVQGKRVRCELNGQKNHDRRIGICYRQGKDIGAEVIKAGLALDCPRFSGGRYRSIEVAAARGKIKLPGYCR